MIKQFTFNHFGVNCYVVYDEVSHQCAIVDPGMEASYEDAQLYQFISQKGLTPTAILLTHAHIDHVCGLRQCCEQYNLPVTMHADGKTLLRQAEAYAGLMGFNTGRLDDLETVAGMCRGIVREVSALSSPPKRLSSLATPCSREASDAPTSQVATTRHSSRASSNACCLSPTIT